MISSSFSRFDTLVSLTLDGDELFFLVNFEKDAINPLCLGHSKQELSATVSSILRGFLNLLGVNVVKDKLDLVDESSKSALGSNETIVGIGELKFLPFLLAIEVGPVGYGLDLLWN